MNTFKKALKTLKDLGGAPNYKTGAQVPPQYNPPPMSPIQPPKPPTSGSNAFKPNPNYIPPASVKPVKKPCPYKTPCGWCTKWDKKCNKKPYKRGLRVKINPVDDAIEPGLILTNI